MACLIGKTAEIARRMPRDLSEHARKVIAVRETNQHRNFRDIQFRTAEEQGGRFPDPEIDKIVDRGSIHHLSENSLIGAS